MAPRCTGMWAAWAIICPRPSNNAHEKSRRSLMLGEKLLRRSAAPISSATEANRCLKISSWIGFSSMPGGSDVEDQIAEAVHPAAVLRFEEYRGVRQDHQPRAAERVAWAQGQTIEHRQPIDTPPKHRLAISQPRLAGIALL